jgi:GntR family transcriptional regulator
LIASAEAGSKLPTEPDLAEQMGVSRSTLREAMRSFEAQGLLTGGMGAGTFVVGKRGVFDTGIEVLESLEPSRRVEPDDYDGRHKDREHPGGRGPGKDLQSAQGQHAGENQPRDAREGRSIAFLQDILPRDVLSTKDLEQGFTGSVLDMLIRRGNPALDRSIPRSMRSRRLRTWRRALEIQRGDVLLMFEADLYAKDGAAVDHSLSYFLPGTSASMY